MTTGVARKLSVWIEGHDRHIGVLDDGPGGQPRFTYSQDYLLLNERKAPALSLSLPRRDEPYTDFAARAFFGNLIQENDYFRKQLTKAGVRRDDTVGVLAVLGKDCAGAVSCTPLGTPKPKDPGILNRDYVPYRNLAGDIQALHERRPIGAQKRDASPLAGVQPKLAVTVIDGKYFEPKNGSPTTHILKVNPKNSPHLCANEAACLSLARTLGVDVAQSSLLKVHGIDCLLVDRFDRRTNHTSVTRLHQEDFAQALGLMAQMKYERERDAQTNLVFNASGIAKLIDQTKAKAESRRKFIRLTLFNLLIANVDNHAKNHALLYTGGRSPELAPAYDLVCTAIDPDITDLFSYKIGKATQFANLTASDLKAFAETLGLKGTGAQKLLAQETEKLIDAASDETIDRILSDLPATIASALAKIWKERRLAMSNLF